MTTSSRWTRVRRALRDGVARLTGTSPVPAPPRATLPDHRGTVHLQYAPALDGDADPGEIVWAWVPFEDDPSQGKDRPVLVIGRESDELLGLMLTSKDHSRDAPSKPAAVACGWISARARGTPGDAPARSGSTACSGCDSPRSVVRARSSTGPSSTRWPWHCVARTAGEVP